MPIQSKADAKLVLGYDDKQVKKGTKETEKNFLSFSTSLKGIGTVGAAGIGLITTATGAMVKQTIDAGAEMFHFSNRIGISTEALSEYRHVAELTNVNISSMNTGLQRMTRRIADNDQGVLKAIESFESMGITIDNLKGLAPEEQFEILADAFNQVEDAGKKTAMAMKFFDTEGVALLQTMTEGSEGIRQMREEARALGLSISGEEARAMADFQDSLAVVSARFKGIATSITKELMPALAGLGDMLEDIFGPEKTVDPMTAISERIFNMTQELNMLREEEARAASPAFAEAFARTIAVKEEALKREFELRKQVLAETNKQQALEKTIAEAPGPSELQLKSEEEARAKLEALKGPAGTARNDLEQLDIDHQAKIEKITAFEMQKIELLAFAGATREEMMDAQAEAEIARQEAVAEHSFKTRQAMLGHAAGFFGNMATIAQSGGKKGQKLAEKFAIVETTINTASAAMGAYKALVGIPIVGPALAAVAFAAAIAKGKQQISAIKSGSSGGGGGAGAVTVPSVSPGPGAGPLPDTPERAAERGTQDITVNIHNPLSEGNWEVIGEDIVKSINKAGDRNITLNVTTNEASEL